MKETKLNSKNPILRFKQGKKILFAAGGNSAPEPTRFSDKANNEYWATNNGTIFYRPANSPHARKLEQTDSRYNAVSKKLIKPNNVIAKKSVLNQNNPFSKDLKSRLTPAYYNQTINDGSQHGYTVKVESPSNNQSVKKQLVKRPVKEQPTEKLLDLPEMNAISIPNDYTETLNLPEQLPQINIQQPQQPKPNPIQLNRSDTRWVIKNALGNNAYNYTGAQRKALRNYLNGVNYDENEIKAFGDLSKFKDYMKKGGLISRNPLNRFKNLYS